MAGSRVAIRTLKDRGFSIEAPRIFNSLPAHIRAFEGSPLALKGLVDTLLSSVPDNPLSDSRPTLAVDDQGLPSNGLRHWLWLNLSSYHSYLTNQ